MLALKNIKRICLRSKLSLHIDSNTEKVFLIVLSKTCFMASLPVSFYHVLWGKTSLLMYIRVSVFSQVSSAPARPRPPTQKSASSYTPRTQGKTPSDPSDTPAFQRRNMLTD